MRTFLALLIALCFPFCLGAHCQLPCGIYHDDLRFAMLEEDIQTLNKAIAEIKSNGGGTPLQNNQMVRSVNLKDEYADKIAHTLTFYFLQQRLNEQQKNFQPMLGSSFKILKLAAQVKASVNDDLVNQLSAEIENFKALYRQSE